jgi:hypothetical protein
VADRFEDAIYLAVEPGHNVSESHRQMVTDLYEFMRISIHHHHVSIPSLSRERAGQMANQRMRISLLTGNMTEAQFKREVQKRDKASSKRNELLQVVLTYRDALADIVAPFIEDGPKPFSEWEAMLDQVRELERYVNSCFATIGDTYGSTVYTISSDQHIR